MQCKCNSRETQRVADACFHQHLSSAVQVEEGEEGAGGADAEPSLRREERRGGKQRERGRDRVRRKGE